MYLDSNAKFEKIIPFNVKRSKLAFAVIWIFILCTQRPTNKARKLKYDHLFFILKITIRCKRIAYVSRSLGLKQNGSF